MFSPGPRHHIVALVLRPLDGMRQHARMDAEVNAIIAAALQGELTEDQQLGPETAWLTLPALEQA